MWVFGVGQEERIEVRRDETRRKRTSSPIVVLRPGLIFPRSRDPSLDSEETDHERDGEEEGTYGGHLHAKTETKKLRSAFFFRKKRKRRERRDSQSQKH